MNLINKLKQLLLRGEDSPAVKVATPSDLAGQSPSTAVPQEKGKEPQGEVLNCVGGESGCEIRPPVKSTTVRPRNNVELRDDLLSAIISDLQPHHFSSPSKVVAGVVLWLSPNCDKQLTEALRSMASENFYGELRVKLRNVGLGCSKGIALELKVSEERMRQARPLFEEVGLELQMLGERKAPIKLVIRAETGYTWEEEYVLRPGDNQGKPFFLGRCRQTKLPNGLMRTNHIAFIGLEEDNDPKYQINSYVSRSTAIIMYDKDREAFCIARSDAHGCSRVAMLIHRITEDGQLQVITLSVPRTYYQLQHDDMLVINKEISLSIGLQPDEEVL